MVRTLSPVAPLSVALLMVLAPVRGAADEPTPVVSWLHTLSIHVRSHAIHDSLHALLAETLQLPRTYEPVTYGERKYVATGVIAGTSIKKRGVTTDPVDPKRAKAFVKAARG